MRSAMQLQHWLIIIHLELRFFHGILPCVIEELAYRGVMFGSFHEAGRLKAILMSGILFGLMHMNFNQMAYAVVIGLIFGFVVEATGSIIPTMIMHFLINGFSVVIKHIANIIPALKDQAENTEVTQTMLLSTIRAYIPMALVGTVISAGIIYLLAVIMVERRVSPLYSRNLLIGTMKMAKSFDCLPRL